MSYVPRCANCGRFVTTRGADPWAVMAESLECDPCGDARGEMSGLHLPPQDEGGEAL